MPKKTLLKNVEKNFIDADKLHEIAERPQVTDAEFSRILAKALTLRGLNLDEVAALLNCDAPLQLNALYAAASRVKRTIYGSRIVLFAPLYVGNVCSNSCTYCGFRRENKKLGRLVLKSSQIREEVEALLTEGHKRLLMLCGESDANELEYFLDAIATAYEATVDGARIRRINVEIAPLDVDGFKRLKEARIGTYVCFQETYDPALYPRYHPQGPKSDYLGRLTVMDRAMSGGIDDVGIGALFGLADFRFEVLALMEHARHLEETFGCGPHTVSVPRIEPADGAPLSTAIPNPVSDDDFKKIISVIRLALPYTGIILSTRESESLRDELFEYGVSQISAGSRTNPGAYAHEESSGGQFSLGDHRTLDEVVSALVEQGRIPSFCTGCYRKGRVGQDFMDLAKPGLIHEFCMPNGLFTFMEYLMDYASPAAKKNGIALVNRLVSEIEEPGLREKTAETLRKIGEGARDLYF